MPHCFARPINDQLTHCFSTGTRHTVPPGERTQSLTLHFVVLSFDRYSRDDVIGEVLLPVYEALEETASTAATIDSNDRNNSAATAAGIADGNNPLAQVVGVVLARDIAPRSHKVSRLRLPKLRRVL